jgi:hypothetical protein
LPTKETLVTNKIAGLYLNLAKALNALEDAGEDPYIDHADLDIVGISAGVRFDVTEKRYVVVQD